MEKVAPQTIEQAVEIIALEGEPDDAIESRVAALVVEPVTARRLIDWIPEGFGFVLVSHMGKVVLPTTFSARNSNGKWEEFPLQAEPIFIASLQIATRMLHTAPRDAFMRLSLRSAVLASVNNALNAGQSIDRATLSGPALIGVPAEVYASLRRPFWKRSLP